MVNLFCESAALGETVTPSPPLLTWQVPSQPPVDSAGVSNPSDPCSWDDVWGLEDQQRRCLKKIHAKGVFLKNENVNESGDGMAFRLEHGGNVDSDGNCLFTSSRRAMGTKVDARELRLRAVSRFLEEYGKNEEEKAVIDGVIRHLYSPDLSAGWGIHVVQEVKVLAKKTDRQSLDVAIQELVDLGFQRESAAETIYKERCLAVNDGESWAKYMSTSGSLEDEYDIITLQYTEDGLLTVEENINGHAAAFGDDIAIESLATEFGREIFVVQAHGEDAMVDEENCVFFFPHRPRGQICSPPFFLFMKGTGWCGSGGDHYEPITAYPLPFVTLENAAIVL